MMTNHEKFEKKYGIDASYDPDGDRETGYYSTAYIKKYNEYLESALQEAQEKIERLKSEVERAKDRFLDIYKTSAGPLKEIERAIDFSGDMVLSFGGDIDELNI